ncbi:MAG: RodZ domain-containing protein [Thermaerobacterales bacterium]
MDLQEIGAILRRRREELGHSIRDAHSTTKVRAQYLEALEQGDDATLPGEVYAKGFLRAYAKFLKLDAEELVSSYSAWKEAGEPTRPAEADAAGDGEDRAGKPTPRPQRPKKPRRPARMKLPGPLPLPPRFQGGRGLGAMLLAILVFAAATLGSIYLYGTVREELPAWLEGRGGPAAEPVTDNGDVDDDPDADTDTEPVEPAPEPEPEAPAEPPPVVMREDAEGRIVYDVPFETMVVILDVTALSWVSVTIDGTFAFEANLEAGETRTLEAAEEIRLRSGNPGGLRITVNDQSMGVPSQTGPKNLRFYRVDAPQ